MTERLFVATDLSERADEALRAAHARARVTGADVGLCYVGPSLRGAHGDDDEGVRHAMRGRVERCMPDDHPELMVRHGTPPATIVHVAAEWSADVIFLGGHGGVAEQVVRHAHCPVLVARRATSRGVVLVATDLSDPRFPALVAARDEARRRGARLVVIHAIDFGSVAVTIEEMALDLARPSESWNVDARIRRRFWAQLRAAMAMCNAEGEVRIVDGAAAPAILRVAEELDAELVVIGTHGRTGLVRIALGSTAERIVRTVARPVLAVPLAAP